MKDGRAKTRVSLNAATSVFLAVMLFLTNGCSKKSSPVGPVSGESVEITSPVEGASVYGTIEVRVSVTSQKAIARVSLFIDGKSDSSLTKSSEPYVFTWGVPEGADSTTHSLQAKAVESDSSVLTSPLVKVAAYSFAPTNLKVDTLSESSITLSWQNNSKFETGFLIERAVGDSAFAQVLAVGSHSTTASIAGPYEVNKNYSFRVRAVSDTNCSNYSNSVIVEIPFPAPFNVHVGSPDDSTMILTWQDTNTITKSFEIDTSEDGNAFQTDQLLNVGRGPNGKYNANMVRPYVLGQNCYFRVRSISKYNYSPFSLTVDTTAAFLPPTGLALGDSVPKGVAIRWNKGGRFTRQFSIYRETGSGGFKEIVVVDSSVRSYVDKNADVAQICRYEVRAENLSYHSDFTPPLSVQYVRDNNYKLYDMMSGHAGDVGSVGFSGDDGMVVSAGADRTVKVWNVAISSLVRTINLHGSVFAAPPAMAVYGSYIAVCDTQNVINVYFLNSGALLKTLKTQDGNLVTGLAFSPDGAYLGAVNTGTMTVWRVSDWSVVMQVTDDLQYAVSFSPDDQYVTAGSTLSGAVSVYQISTATRTALLKPFGYFIQWAVSFSPDGKNIAFGGEYGNVLAYPSTGGSEINSLSYAGGRAIRCIAYSPDGTLLAAGGNGSEIDIWQNGTLLRKIPENGDEIGMVFSHDGCYLATGDDDNNVRVYRCGGVWEELK